jgi:hypothetical protein
MTAMFLLLLAMQVTADDAELRVRVHDAVRAAGKSLADVEGSDDLIAWTLVNTWDEPRHRGVKPRVERLLAAPPMTTSQAALRAMTLARLHPARYRSQLRYCAQFLADNQAVDGLWGEGTAIDPIERDADDPPPPAKRERPFAGSWLPKPFAVKVRRAGPAAGDVANARWAVEGLQAIGAWGRAKFPPELLARAAEAWRAPGREPGDVAWSLNLLLLMQGREPVEDPHLRKALGGLSTAELPADPWRLYERGRETALRDVHAATRALLAAQKPDGTWGGLRETCGAVRFLTDQWRGWFTHPNPTRDGDPILVIPAWPAWAK